MKSPFFDSISPNTHYFKQIIQSEKNKKYLPFIFVHVFILWNAIYNSEGKAIRKSKSNKEKKR